MTTSADRAAPPSVSQLDVARVRAFNRFYTRSIGVLRDGLAGSRFSLVEARVLHELAHWGVDPAAPPPTGRPLADGPPTGRPPADGPPTDGRAGAAEGSELRQSLDLDAGHLSRILARFDAAGLITRQAHPTDARRQLVGLTDAGRAAFGDLDERQVTAVAGLLEPLSAGQRGTLTEAMGTIERTLGGPTRPRGFVLRPPQPGDLGWIVSRHGALYVDEYGGDPRFEAIVARIVANYAEQHDPAREAVWIADVDGRPAGSIACMADDPSGVEQRTARLRLLLVEPTARGMGVGERLVAECLRFAQRARYSRVVLWTTSGLDSARRIYQRAGFTLDDEAPYDGFGHGVVAQNWSRPLTARPR